MLTARSHALKYMTAAIIAPTNAMSANIRKWIVLLGSRKLLSHAITQWKYHVTNKPA